MWNSKYTNSTEEAKRKPGIQEDLGKASKIRLGCMCVTEAEGAYKGPQEQENAWERISASWESQQGGLQPRAGSERNQLETASKAHAIKVSQEEMGMHCSS